MAFYPIRKKRGIKPARVVRPKAQYRDGLKLAAMFGEMSGMPRCWLNSTDEFTLEIYSSPTVNWGDEVAWAIVNGQKCVEWEDGMESEWAGLRVPGDPHFNNLTLIAHIKKYNNSSEENRILSKHSATGYGFFTSILTSNVVRFNLATSGNGTWNAWSSSVSVSDDEECYLVASYDGTTRKIKKYSSVGALVSSDSNTHPTGGNIQNHANQWTLIGCDKHKRDEAKSFATFEGAMFEMLAWDHAKSDGEIQGIVNSLINGSFLEPKTILVSLGGADGAINGTAAETLDDFTSTASGVLKYSGTSTETLADFTSSAEGNLAYSGTSAETLEDFTGAAVGAVAEFVGSLAETLEDFSPSASGHLTYSGTSTETLADFTSSADGEVQGGAVTGTVAETLEAYSPSAEGTVANPVTGDIAITMADFIASAAGTVPGVGTGISGGNYGRIIGITLPPRRRKEEREETKEIPVALEPITEAEVQRAIEANMSLVPRIMEQAFVPRSQAIVMLRAQIEEDLERQRQDNFRQTTGLQLDFISSNLRTLMHEMDDIKAIMTLLLAKQ